MPLNPTLDGLVTPLTRQTLSADVYRQLRDLLMSGRVVPGEQFSLRGIAEALGVSVMPVREAVNRLVAEQALEVTSNRSLRVPIMSAGQFREITCIRTELEGLATARAATARSEAALKEIVRSHERFAKEITLPKPDPSRLIETNKDFHFAVYRQAGMPMLLQMIESLWLRIGPILNYDLRTESSRVIKGVPADHHARIVAALRDGDAAGAERALRGDIESAAEHIIATGALATASSKPTPISRR
ncbi:GntR family transcriptional regulator [Bordetella genomosp. 1]|uniref:GntR family transcriptional regulator n=1 Tax=Bordetella genomosp. 1 TaxID=1395607 RepID=A0A261SQW5_9BORD|nr:GntR family transcriptional regulator [Bordetella genomosp. 1]OZI39230.1 GntR family transcriptional regulator [Bordetella genomosp. 1]